MSQHDFPRGEAGAGGEMATAVALLIVAVLVLSSFLLFQAVADRRALLATITAQEQPLQQAQQIKSQLTSLAAGVAKLAGEGDIGAKEVIANMKTQGIRIQP